MNAPAAPLSLALLGHPNSGKTALFNLLTGSRQKVANYAADGIQTTDTAGATSFDVKRRVQELWNDEVQDALRGTVWNAGGCGSYYLDANGRNSSIYPWTTLRFRRDTRQFDLNDYDLTLPTPEAPRAPEKATIAA